jgi:hypothetical protein
MMTKK